MTMTALKNSSREGTEEAAAAAMFKTKTDTMNKTKGETNASKREMICNDK